MAGFLNIEHRQKFFFYSQTCQSVLAVYINVNSVVWTLIEKKQYQVKEWKYYPVEYPDGKKLQITDIYDIVRRYYLVFDCHVLYFIIDLFVLKVLYLYIGAPKVLQTDRSCTIRVKLTRLLLHLVGRPQTLRLPVPGSPPNISIFIFQASSITAQLPPADIYVMKAEATSLRAAGSDPSNIKTIAVNLQKAQMIAMIVALINSSGDAL